MNKNDDDNNNNNKGKYIIAMQALYYETILITIC